MQGADTVQDFNLHHRRSRTAFTLVDMLVVMVIMSILAAKAIPRFAQFDQDARMNSMRVNENLLNQAIQRYRAEHGGRTPTISQASLPQLLSRTDVNGNIGRTAAHKYGPYLDRIPPNTLNENSSVYSTTSTSPNVTNLRGWWYNAAIGRVWGGLSTAPGASAY